MAYSHLTENIEIAQFAPLYAGMAAFGRDDLLAKYSTSDMKTSILTLSANYDPGNWFVMGEYVGYKGDSILSDATSWYVAGGYRFGKFTPYLIHSDTKAKVETETSGGAGAVFLNPGINMALNQAAATQTTTAVGLRWDAYKNVAVKLQYDRLDVEKTARIKPMPGYVPGKIDLVTLGVDFVF